MCGCQDAVTSLSTISGMEASVDFNYEWCQAACWLVNNDLKEHKDNDPKLIQRCALAALYLTTGGANWEANLGFMGVLLPIFI